MSRRKLRVRSKITQKMSRDGLTLCDTATGENKRVSKRDAEVNLREKTPEREAPDAKTDGAQKARTAYSQLSTPPNLRFGGNPGGNRQNGETKGKKAVRQHNGAKSVAENRPQRLDIKPTEQPTSDLPLSPRRDTTLALPYKPADSTRQLSLPPPIEPRDSLKQTDGGDKPQTPKQTSYRHQRQSVVRHEPPKTDSPIQHEQTWASAENTANTDPVPLAAAPDNAEKPSEQPDNTGTSRYKRYYTKLHDGKSKFKPQRDTAFKQNEITPETNESASQFEIPQSETPTIPENKASGTHTNEGQILCAAVILPDVPPDRTEVQEESSPEPDVAPVQNDTAQSDTAVTDEPENAEKSVKSPNSTAADGDAAGDTPIPHSSTETSLKPEKPGKLKFTEDEAAPEKPKNRKLIKAEKQAEQAGVNLEKAKNKLPAKRKLRSERVFDETKGKSKRRLYFEKEVKTQGQHLKGAMPLRPIKAAGNTAIANAHRKIFQVEHENVSVRFAHRAEMLAEGGVRSALRFHKTAPYRKVAKFEKKASKKTVKLTYQKALAENPKLSSNMLSRMYQKRKIKKDYAKKAREAKKAAGAVKQAGSVTAKAAKTLASVIAKHPVAAAVIVLIALLLFLLMSLFSLGSGLGSGGLGGILTASYLAEDEDIEESELVYSEWETDLRLQILNTETDHPDYDEYLYEIGDIGHNPFELMAYLTAVYQYFTFDAISTDLRALFDEQYSVTFIESAETRYADPTDANEDGDYEPYEWKILTVSLVSRAFVDVIVPAMTDEQQQHYATLMQTKGCRQYAGNPFDVSWLPYVSSYYGWRVHPITGVKDLHRGIDIAFPIGTEIHSVQDGTVTFAGYSGDYGNVVIIENDNGIVTKYAHCDTLLVSTGQTVTTGDSIATVGNTGASTGPHLHLELLKDGQYANPLYFMDAGII